jgi:hypothetical protein
VIPWSYSNDADAWNSGTPELIIIPEGIWMVQYGIFAWAVPEDTAPTLVAVGVGDFPVSGFGGWLNDQRVPSSTDDTCLMGQVPIPVSAGSTAQICLQARHNQAGDWHLEGSGSQQHWLTATKIGSPTS